MIYQAAFLVAALICFVIAALAVPTNPRPSWGWLGVAILVVYVLLTKGHLI